MATLVERASLLEAARHRPDIQAAHLELCRRDPIYYFQNFCYTYDPRDTENPIKPFNLYAYQIWAIRKFKWYIDHQKDFGVEKSRTMGASWMLIILFQWYWLFVPGSSFQVGSITQDDIDKCLIDPEDTLFGKLRFNMQYLPRWMKPDYTDKFLSLRNNDNGNIISGRAPTANFGRGSRKKAMLFDEAAFWAEARAAWESASQTTRCRIMNSTANGKHNLYGQTMTDPKNKKIIWSGRAAMVKAKGIYTHGQVQGSSLG